MRLEQVVPGTRPATDLTGAVLARDLRVGGERWSKGRRLDAADLDALTSSSPAEVGAESVTVLVMEAGDLHEDEAAIRLAAAVRGPGLDQRGPSESRIDLLAAQPGVLHVRSREIELLDRIDPLEVFTALDGSVVATGQLVASVKVAPHVVPASIVDRGVAIARAGQRPLVWVAPFVPDAGRRASQGVAPRRRPRALRAQRPGQGRVAGLVGRCGSSTCPTRRRRSRQRWRR